MKIRQDKLQPLFRQKFSDWMANQENRWTSNVQDDYLSWLTSAMYKNLLNGELCADSYDPYLEILFALRKNDVDGVKQVLENVSEILSSEISDSAPQSTHYINVSNWQSAWKAYSEFINEIVIPSMGNDRSKLVEQEHKIHN